MEITKETLDQIEQILNQSEDFRPLIKLFSEKIKSFSGELSEVLNLASKWIVSNRIDAIRQYMTAGFEKDDAIIMTLDDIYGIKKLSERMNKK